MKSFIKFVSFLTLTLGLSQVVNAQRITGHSLGFSLGLTGPTQTDVNSWVTSLAQVGTQSLSGGYEFLFDYQYRFSRSMFSLLFRPSYITQSASGGDVKTSLTSFNMFPMLRMTPLENSFLQFFLQVGVGYGTASLSLQNGGVSGSYSSSNFGAIAGLGANFCFTANHCMVVEGNFRYLPMPRLTGNANGNLGGNVTQSTGELEKDNVDLSVSLSGVQGLIGYRFNF